MNCIIITSLSVSIQLSALISHLVYDHFRQTFVKFVDVLMLAFTEVPLIFCANSLSFCFPLTWGWKAKQIICHFWKRNKLTSFFVDRHLAAVFACRTPLEHHMYCAWHPVSKTRSDKFHLKVAADLVAKEDRGMDISALLGLVLVIDGIRSVWITKAQAHF